MMENSSSQPRRFLFLQGPHGPFFARLGRMLKRAGCEVWRIGFNAGDAAFWRDRASYLPFNGTSGSWPAHIASLLDEKCITDLVLYGDTRPIHASAIAAAKTRGITVHVFEEGYIRPFWITYERDGANGHSRLMQLSLSDMQDALATSDMETALPPAHWGDMRHHIFYGALYHWFVMFLNQRYPNFRPHRTISVAKEFRLYIRRLLLMPFQAVERRIATWRVRNGGFPYHLALLQLEHDSSFQKHSPFKTMTEFLELVLGEFEKGAPGHHHLVVKAHPLEDGRVPVRKSVKEIAKKLGITDRVHYVRGGKLAQLLDEARTAVTVNSTAGQQALWRGVPLRIFGSAVYDKAEFISRQPLAEFFANPTRPNAQAYRDYRRFLLETSQLPGGFYSRHGRRQLLRQIVDLMLVKDSPYATFQQGTAAPRQQLRVVNNG